MLNQDPEKGSVIGGSKGIRRGLNPDPEPRLSREKEKGVRTKKKELVRIEEKENKVSGYAKEEEEKALKYPSFKSNRLKRRRKLVNDSASQVITNTIN